MRQSLMTFHMPVISSLRVAWAWTETECDASNSQSGTLPIKSHTSRICGPELTGSPIPSNDLVQGQDGHGRSGSDQHDDQEGQVDSGRDGRDLSVLGGDSQDDQGAHERTRVELGRVDVGGISVDKFWSRQTGEVPLTIAQNRLKAFPLSFSEGMAIIKQPSVTVHHSISPLEQKRANPSPRISKLTGTPEQRRTSTQHSSSEVYEPLGPLRLEAPKTSDVKRIAKTSQQESVSRTEQVGDGSGS